MITREVVLPVQFDLYARPGATLDGVRHILTHPHAAAQCRDWLALHLPEALVTEGGSTAAAAAEVADPLSRFDAAICAPVAGEMHGLTALAEGIADNPDAVTRFVLVSRPGQLGPADRARTRRRWCCSCGRTTPVRCWRSWSSSPAAGSTCAGSSRGRPSASWATTASRSTRRATSTTPGWPRRMMGLHRICGDVVFLGSYPRADRTEPIIPVGTSNADYAAAATWLQRLKG